MSPNTFPGQTSKCHQVQGSPPRGTPTRLVLALDVEARDGAVAVEAHGPTQGDGPVLHLPDLYFRGVRGLWGGPRSGSGGSVQL